MHALALDADGPRPALPGRVDGAPGRPHRRRRRPRACCSTSRPTRSTTWPRISSVAQSWDEPDLTARVNGIAAVALLESALAGSRSAPAGRCGSCRPPAPRSSASRDRTPAGRVHADPPGQPVRRREGLRPPDGRRLPAPRTCTPSALILYNHESPRRPDQFVTRKITSTVAAIARGGAGPPDPRQPRRPPRLGLGARLRRRDGPRRPRRRGRRLRHRHRGGPHACATSSPPPSPRAGIADWEPLRRPSTRRSSAPPTPPSWSATPRKARAQLGWAPTVDFDEVVGRMVDADLLPLGSSRSATRPLRVRPLEVARGHGRHGVTIASTLSVVSSRAGSRRSRS